MRRHVLVLGLLAGLTTLVPPARSEVYGGESLVAHAGVRVRGTDGEQYQLEVQVARHSLGGARVDHVLRFRLATCNEHGCFGPWYAVPVKASDVTFTDETAHLRTTFAGTRFDVQWKARRAKKNLQPTSPAPAAVRENGAIVVSAHRDVRSAPAVVRFVGLACKTAASSMANQTGLIVTEDDRDEQNQPDRLPKGFYPAPRRKPRCF